jgi:hypothetical protein
LAPYEVYLLLAAIHMHDVGNVYGRKGHELAAEKVMRDMGPMAGDDVEKRLVLSIAMAHGGEISGDKDKIRLLKDEIEGETKVDTRALAAILRFADELADDKDRCSRFLIEEGLVPKSNRVYHKYAEALRSVDITVPGDKIELKFFLRISDVRVKHGKGTESVYLFDEICDRTMKMHRERMYCMRFLRPMVSIDKIVVKISVFEDDFSGDVIHEMEYQLEEQGYPDEIRPNIYDLVPALRAGSRLMTGKYLAQKLKSRKPGKPKTSVPQKKKRPTPRKHR